MSKKKVVFNAYDLLNSPEMSAYLDQHEAEESERQKRRDAEMAARQRQSGSKPGHSVSDDELSADALKRDNISQTTGDISGRANDVWQALKSGGAQLIQGAGWLANEAGAHDSGQFLYDIGQIGKDQALANMTPAGREAQKNGVFKEDLSGVNDDWGRGMAQGIAGSAVPSIVGAVLGAPVARGIGAAGNALLGRAAVSEGALGSVLDAAIKYTPDPVMRLAGALPGAAGAGAGEAAVTGATNGAQAYQEVMDAPIESLRKSPAFQSLSKELGSEDAARKAIADRMSIQTAKDTALSTGLIGAAMGGGAVGSLLNKFAVKQGAKEVGRLGAKAAAKEVLKDGAKEFSEEFAQSGPEHYLQNAAKRDYLDPTIDPSTGMLRASLEGGVVGTGQGMGMSGGAHAVNRLLARNEPQPSQPANTPQQQPNTQPSSTPKSVAGYDPIAPNQQALLQRLGVEPDPAADEAAASVESIFGTGDPTAGLVASVMRGDALQPIHDLAAVRANTILPVGSNEGGLYEPQWLPDAAQGESANGLPMPKHGFDSQEKLLGNVRLDARDADLMRAKDEAFSRYEQEQQQAAARKPQDLERVYQDSIVPATIDRADASNQLNQALANASGEGVAVPNAMQLALQQAKSRHASVPDASTHALPTELPTELKSNSVDAQRTHGDDKSREIATNHASVDAPALTMQQNERGQWMIKGDMAQHAQAIREALPGTKLVVSQQNGQALVQMPADKDTASQGKAIRKALDHLLLSGEQLAARDQQRADASERAKAANRQARQIDPERDDIVNAVAKLGGIDTEQALSEWWRGQRETVGHYNAEVPGNLRRQGVFAFKRGGMAIDDMVRHLEGEGYLPHNATPNDLLDALENRSKHPAGYEADARREFDARQQEEQANAPGEFQQAYDDGRFADEFTASELEEDGFFDLNRKQREAAEAAAEAAKFAELDKLIDNAQVIASQSGPVTEEELDAIFGPQSRNTTTESPQADRGAATERTTAGAGGGAQATETAQTEDGFGLASYTESDLRREEQAAEQQQREVERQRAAADKARQDEETRKEIRRRSEAAADTFTLGGNAEDNLTGQGGLFDAPTESSSAQNSNDEGGIKRGKVGMMLAPGEIVLTASGRETTPFPAFQTKTGKTTGKHLAEVDRWLLQNAADEALSRGDKFNEPVFRRSANNPKSISQSDKDGAEEYLFGTQPSVVPSILKPLSESSSAPTATDEMAALKAEMGDAIGELASLLGVRKNLTAEEEAKIIPVMAKIFRIAAKMGYIQFKEAGRYVIQQIRQIGGDELANKLSIDNLQAGYINIAKEIGGDKREALAYESIHELEGEPQQGANESQSDNSESATDTTAPSLVDKFAGEIANGNMPKDNNALRKMVAAMDGKQPDAFRMKQAQEDLEAAIVVAARSKVADGGSTRDTFNRLVDLYQSQPNLNIRTSTSIANQAYSTPAPLAYVAAKLADITSSTHVFEPTAGNGMLLLTAAPRNATANELDDQRFTNLQAQGFDAMQGNALDAVTSGAVAEKSQDAVITNPPFGSVKDDAGKATKINVDGYKIGKIDHLIAADALRTMKDGGKAVLIIGADKVAGGLSTDDRIFFNWLYSHYNVTHHFEVDGSLYSRQGASWPVRVIALNGRVESNGISPKAGTVERVSTWEQVYGQLEQGLVSQDRRIDRNAASGADGSVSGSTAANEQVNSPVVIGGKAQPRNNGGRARSTAGAADVGGRGAGTGGNTGQLPAEGMGAADSAQRRNESATGQAGLESGNPERVQASATAGSDQPSGNSGANRVTTLADAENAYQARYVPASSRKDDGVLIPVNMAQPLSDALAAMEDETGNIDQFAAKELGYRSVGELHQALMGLQVDSVATAVRNLKNGNGTIIADQTGIGKGRQAAAIIRWAVKNGRIPVFVTVKPALFTDMYNDLADIGSHDIAPFILNVDESISGASGNKLFANKKATHKQNLNAIANSGTLPDDTNAVFMTYSQINTANIQRSAIAAIAPRAIFVLDESHNAGGESATGEYIKGLLDTAPGVVYLSATYAKRPDNMPLYFRTDIGKAIADDSALKDAMANGGLPLQTVVSNNLVKAGQMFRRERSYDGISISTVVDSANKERHVELADKVTSALRAIVSADKAFHENYFEAAKKALEKEGKGAYDNAGNQAGKSVDHSEFSSVVHNFVRQLLLGLKADAAADHAIAALKRGEKPLIALENTMGSFLSEYAAGAGIQVGKPLGDFDYRTVLSRALKRSRYIQVDDGKGNKSKQYIGLEKLDPVTRLEYDNAQEVIDSLDVADIPVSPLDWIRYRLQKAGYSVAEITGRDLAVDYSKATPVLANVPSEEQSDKVLTTRRFNSGKLDAIILNVSGSTGISLHASEKFSDKRPRHMIVAQPAQDINIFMQMLGRIHRTGQVVLPDYTILNVDLPAEKRPTALLSKKMKSLNANTSSNTESATSVQSVDILNKYGDQVVADYLQENIDLAQAMNIEVSADAAEDIARRVTGRLALMPVETQHRFYSEVEEQYQSLIDYLNKTNQNDLEPRTFDFDAKETRRETLVKASGESPFEQAADYIEFSIKAQGKAMTPDEIKAEISDNLQGKQPSEHAADMVASLNEKYQAFVAEQQSDSAREKAAGAKMAGERFILQHPIGSTWRVEINDDHYNAVIINIKNSHKSAGNPFSLSKTTVTIAVNGSLRQVSVPATQFEKITTSQIYSYGPYQASVDRYFSSRVADERETAKMITGNLLAAYGELSGVHGTIVNFSRADGSVDQGILLPKRFDFKQNTSGDYRFKSGSDAYKFLRESNSKGVDKIGVQNREQTVRVTLDSNGIAISVPKSKAKGGKYFGDTALTKITGDFVSAGGMMNAYVDKQNAEAAIDTLIKKTALYAIPSMAEEARKIVGDEIPEPTASVESTGNKLNSKANDYPPAGYGGAIDSNEPKADYTDHYETDLFGNPLPNAGRKTRATKPAPSGVRRDVHAASALPGDTAAPDGEYRVRTIVGSESQRTLGARRITSLDDLAAATSYLYRSAVERFDAIVTDASGKPLAVIGAFKGAIDQASVYPATLVGEAVRIPGAAHIWFSHNHPSGTAKLSNADQTLYHRLADIFDGSGIKPMGLIAVANRQYASMEDGYLPIPQSSESMPVPVVERELSATDIDMPAITSPQSAKDLASSLYNGSDYQPGMMLLNTQNQLAAWVPLPATAMGALRHSGGLNAIYRAISESNAGAVILVHGGELSESIGGVTLGQNIAAAVAKLDVRPLDIIDIRKPRSAAETGELIQSGPVYSKANDYTSTQGMSANELQAIIAKALPAHLRERVKVAQSRSNNAQQSARSEDRDLIEAEYDPATGQLTLYADAIPTPERALFVLSHELTHYGLDAKYGFGLSSILLEARNNPMIAKLAAEIAVDRKMTVNSVRQDIADALGVPVARVARSVAVHRLQVETANEALAELNAAIERNDFAYLQDRYGVAVPKMMRNDLRGRLSRLAASVKAWLAKLTGKQASDYSDKQVWDLLAGVRETVRGGGNVAESMSGRSGQNGGKGNILRSTAPKQPASAGFVLPEETTAQQAQREVQDNMNRWKQVLENVREQGGQVDEQNDVVGAEERFHGRTATRIEDFARDEVEPLMQRLAKSGHTLQDIELFLKAQHAPEANARIREIDDSRDTAFGMEDDEAQSILAKFAAMPDAAEFKRLANDFRRISEGTLSLYVKAGIVAPEAAHAMRLAYQFYVPVKGGDEDQAARQGTGKGLSVNGKQKRRMGHDMRDEHVLENMLRDRQRAIVLAEKNNVGTYLLDLIERNPDPKLWTVNVLPKQKVLRDQVSYVVELNGQTLDAFNSLEAARVFIQAEAARTGSKPGAFAVSKSSDPYVTMMAKPTLQDHEVQVYVQGQPVRIQLHDPILAGQYRRMGTEQMGRIIEAGKALNRWLSKVYTGYNPEFFVKNVVRDLFAGTINLTADQGAKVTAKALLRWPKAGAAMFHFALHGKAPSGEYGKALQRYRAAGGSTGAAYMGDLERQADTLQTLYENYSGAMAALQEGKPGKAAKIATRKLLGGLAHWFEVWNQAGENAFRLATFMAMQESGKTVAESASMAKNVTVNFNRKGELTPQLGGLYLFFNPGVQGTARLWQSLAGKDTKHKKQAWALVGSMAGAALALAMMNRGDDEDEWEAIPDSVKDRNLIIPLGNKRKLTIPLPYGYSFFVSLANRLDAVMHGESAEKASIRLASSLFENFSPVGNPIGDDPKGENLISMLPTAVKMVMQPAFGINDFGSPMRPEYNASQPDNEKMWRGTRGSLYDKAAQGISALHGSPYENNWNDVSPETLKYWVKTLTGGTGAFMADSASLLNVLASGSTPDVSEVPFMRSAVRESTVKDVRARFHELGKEAKGHVDAWKRAVDAGDDKAAGEYEQDSELMALGEMLSGYKEQASTLRDLMAEEMKRDDLSLSEKRLKQKMYERQEADVYSEFIRQFKH